MTKIQTMHEEKIIHPKSGLGMLLLNILLLLASIAIMIFSCYELYAEAYALGGILLTFSILLMVFAIIMLCGLRIVHPKEAMVLTLFGKYHGTVKEEGFYWVVPFCSSLNPASKASITTATNAGKGTGSISYEGAKKISLKASTLNNDKQKVNDQLGNPIIVGAIVIWQVENTAKAVFNVQNYKTYLSIQCDSIIRNVSRRYPYDTNEGSDEKSLRGSSQEVSEIMKEELQEKVEIAGLKIIEVRITNLAYAPEIASAMLQRQQAVAIIDARQKIVDGAVSMVEMALQKLSENEIVELDEERKAAMVSNLLVVLCGNKDAQPIINSGTIY